MKIILASKSPRRIDLLKTITEDFEVLPSEFNEDDIKKTESNPDKLVEKLSLEKALDVFAKHQKDDNDLIVIGGDTVVFFENEIIGKPINEQDAVNTLKKLQGKSNYVYTGLTVIIKESNKITRQICTDKTKVYMKEMTENDIKEYVETKEPLDLAGSYSVQGSGNKFIEKIEGNYYTAVGMDKDNLKKILSEYCQIK